MSELNPPDHSSPITCNQSSRNVSTIKDDLILCTCGINGGYNFKSRVELQLLRAYSFLPYNFGCVHRAAAAGLALQCVITSCVNKLIKGVASFCWLVGMVTLWRL